MNQLAGLITESQARKMMAVLNETVELKLTDLGPEFEKIVKEIFGENAEPQFEQFKTTIKRTI